MVVVPTGAAVVAYAVLGSVVIFQRTTDKARVALITFVGISGVLIILILSLLFVGPNSNIAYVFIRCRFIFLAIMMPASLFFLFIATRRESLFNAYAANLDRAGLLRPRRPFLAPDDESTGWCWRASQAESAV
jgi:hypothetical protein